MARGQPASLVEPDPARHRVYLRLYEDGYAPLQGPLRRYNATYSEDF